MHGFGIIRIAVNNLTPKIIFYGLIFTVRFGTKCSASAFVLQLDSAIQRFYKLLTLCV